MNNAAEYRVTIAMPRARAWEKLRDLGLAHNYVPGLVRTEITTGARTGVGASRRVYQSETRFLDETVIDWGEGHGFVIRLHRGNNGAPAPFSEATFRYWLDDAEDGNTSLCTTLAYTVRWGCSASCSIAWCWRKPSAARPAMWRSVSRISTSVAWRSIRRGCGN